MLLIDFNKKSLISWRTSLGKSMFLTSKASLGCHPGLPWCALECLGPHLDMRRICAECLNERCGRWGCRCPPSLPNCPRDLNVQCNSSKHRFSTAKHKRTYLQSNRLIKVFFWGGYAPGYAPYSFLKSCFYLFVLICAGICAYIYIYIYMANPAHPIQQLIFLKERGLENRPINKPPFSKIRVRVLYPGGASAPPDPPRLSLRDPVCFY